MDGLHERGECGRRDSWRAVKLGANGASYRQYPKDRPIAPEYFVTTVYHESR